ncbi:MAG: response regulator, partial [Cyanobacteriota bacterium]|nr:response regulator [Cyanobacteriota bacterium]
IKFTDNGSVTFSVELVEVSALTTQQPTASIKFQVEDTGVGIKESETEQIFCAFEQVGDKKRQSEGTGLGLAISQRIVELMGSKIQVKSQLGLGSIFSFEIDLSICENWAQKLSANNGQQIIGYEGLPYHLLIVDDKWENRSVLSDLLEPLGFKITQAQNGQEALIKVKQQPVNLIITDITMPVMDGLQMVKHLLNDSTTKHITVIVSSASVSDMDRMRSLDAGGDDFLPKPINVEDLFSLLEKHLQLTWKYQQNLPFGDSDRCLDESYLIVPPTEDLQILFELAQDGLLIALAKTVEEIAERNNSYLPFTQKILKLAKQFNTDGIEELLNKYINSEQSSKYPNI